MVCRASTMFERHEHMVQAANFVDHKVRIRPPFPKTVTKVSPQTQW